MNKTAIKIFACFSAISTTTALILLIINFLCFAFIASDASTQNSSTSPTRTLEHISNSLINKGHEFELTDDTVIPPDHWCILIDENGSIIWSQNQPDDIPNHYSLNDVARMTRWFLNDYPVYVRTEDYGLLVLGTPKNSVGKYDIQYSMGWFNTLPQRILGVFLFNLFLATVLAFLIGLSLYKRLTVLTNGIHDLRQEKHIQLKEKGIFKELIRNINNTAAAIERKNSALAIRDHARLNWIAGISHDIRTPLALVLGNSEALENSCELSKENRKKARTITTQSIKIKKLIEDLNLISSLEYDMQPAKRKPVRLCPFIRETVSTIINSGLSDLCEIDLDLQDEKMTISADDFLLERAIFNLISNSITHNKNGCKILVRAYAGDNAAHIIIADNGTGVPDTVIEHISEIPKSAHGLGLPMAYKIISVHGGRMTAKNENGFVVKIELPI